MNYIWHEVYFVGIDFEEIFQLKYIWSFYVKDNQILCCYLIIRLSKLWINIYVNEDFFQYM